MFVHSVQEAELVVLPVQLELPTSFVPAAFPTDAVHRFRHSDSAPVPDGLVAVAAREYQTDGERQVQGRGIGFPVSTRTVTHLRPRFKNEICSAIDGIFEEDPSPSSDFIRKTCAVVVILLPFAVFSRVHNNISGYRQSLMV